MADETDAGLLPLHRHSQTGQYSSPAEHTRTGQESRSNNTLISRIDILTDTPNARDKTTPAPSLPPSCSRLALTYVGKLVFFPPKTSPTTTDIQTATRNSKPHKTRWIPRKPPPNSSRSPKSWDALVSRPCYGGEGSGTDRGRG